MSRKLVATSAALIAVVTALAGCSSSSGTTSTDGPAAMGENINIAVFGNAASFDPLTQAQGAAGTQYTSSAYESLVYQKPDGSLTPGVATSWTYVSGTELTMELRQDVVFSDGTKLTPELAVANLKRAKATTGPEQSRLNDVSEITNKGWTIDIKLSGPNTDIPQALSGGLGAMISQAAIDNPKLMVTATAGSGPWILDAAKSVSGSTYVYALNPAYSGPMKVGFKQFTFKVITDLTASLNALLSNDVDVAVAQYSQREAAEAAGMAGEGVNINMSGIWLVDRGGVVSKPLADVRVRQAMNYAVDRTTIAKALWSKYARPTDQIFTDGTTGYDPALDGYYKYDPNKAKQLLAQAGYADGFTIDVLSRQNFGENDRLSADIPYLAAVGIKVNLVDRTADFPAAFASGQFPAAQNQGNMFTSTIAAQNFLAPNAVNNPFHTTDPALTALIAKAQGELDPAVAATNWKAVSKWVVENAWFMPIAQYQTHGIYNPKVVTGVEVTSVNPVPMTYTMRPPS